ncbi:DNA-binding transcriptional regulator, XRE-family HTH domain [Chryseobacterium carnipullorum]|uniref:helix-turn-helix domain-containing protein n=1 Tax=Chryseobacterium carnipullorum TaxID=1124835 RepID=UPI0009113846|nr:helix-turn-helix transcriptional regulator [Chryseobacterium carnipullorum]SHL61513.1 DNA-binding transcriptional regulator, XRE-family HTH domain [Chryseobacterium carnipullorum]
MEKEKLRRVRKQKGFTQQEIADFIATDVSNYSRKESGGVKITRNEWDKIAKFLDVPVEEIYEEEEISVVVNNEYNTINDQAGIYNVNGNNSNNYNIPNSVIDNLQKYIVLLEEEIKRLKEGKK